MSTLFTSEQLARWQARLHTAPDASGPPDRQPLHVVYGGAHRFRVDISEKLGRLASDSLDAYAPDAETFAQAIGIEGSTDRVYARVRDKLTRQPVDDFRIDFEDGYGNRADEEEDRHARAVGATLSEGSRRGSLPPMIGVRIKSLDGPTASRALRTLSLVLEALEAPVVPLYVTLPKVTRLDTVAVAAEALDTAERAKGWPEGTLQLEVMLEHPALWFDTDGRFALPRLPAVAGGRLAAVHLGPYDYTAAIGIAGADQSLFHPALDVARHWLQVGLSGANVRLGDGPTMLMPIAPHRAKDGALTDDQRHKNRAAVHAAWRNHADAVRASMRRGFDLGWDLHPAQIPARLGAVYAAYLEQLPTVAARLRNFVEAAGQATRVGTVFDDAATGQGLVNFCLRAITTGALSESEILEATGLSSTLLATRSFTEIVRATA